MAKKADIKSFVEKTPRESWSIWKGYPLPKATKDSVKYHVPWYSLEFDIKDANGRIIYPKGFTYNPLEYMRYPTRIVIFKLDQYEAIKHLIKSTDMLVADGGDVVKAAKDKDTHFFILDKKMVSRLGIKKLPTIVSQEKKRLKLREIYVEK